MTALQFATVLHETYEQMAPGYGPVVRLKTPMFVPMSLDGSLMIKVAERMLQLLDEEVQEADRLRARLLELQLEFDSTVEKMRLVISGHGKKK